MEEEGRSQEERRSQGERRGEVRRRSRVRGRGGTYLEGWSQGEKRVIYSFILYCSGVRGEAWRSWRRSPGERRVEGSLTGSASLSSWNGQCSR